MSLDARAGSEQWHLAAGVGTQRGVWSAAFVAAPDGGKGEAEEPARPPLAEGDPRKAEQAGCYARGLRILMVAMALLVILSMLLQMSQWFGLRWRPERIAPPDWWRMEERALESGSLAGSYMAAGANPVRAATTLDGGWGRNAEPFVWT